MSTTSTTPLRPVPSSGAAQVPELPRELQLRIHRLMLQDRVLEERLIHMYKQGDGYFWIGGPGEEAFSIPLGLLVDKGQGTQHDYLHLHYRSSGTLLAMGVDPIDSLRQMKNTATDPYSGGRNFAGHYSIRDWNVVPISSPIEVQYSMAPGTALAQKRAGGRGITIVTGGDAGTAEGDFSTCLVWASRPANELPILIIVTNNKWGISTPYGGSTASNASAIGPRSLASRRRPSTATTPRSRTASWPRRWTMYAARASRSCWRRWSRACMATRRPRAQTPSSTSPTA
jgi:2-oxoisovalerate dehydrogenase E1 component alpha subunit